MDIRLLACDMDGTLVSRDSNASERTVAALRDAAEAGIVVALITSRPPRWSAKGATRLRHWSLIASANGVVIQTQVGVAPSVSYAFDSTEILRLKRLADEAFGMTYFGLETIHEFSAEANDAIMGTPDHLGALPQLLSGDDLVVKLLCRVTNKGAVTEIPSFKRKVADIAEVHMMRRNPLLLEIRRRHVNKGTTVAAIARDAGLSAQNVMAIGDMPSDVPMLEWAGCGVAMEDGHDFALMSCDLVAPPFDADGAAQVIENLIG